MNIRETEPHDLPQLLMLYTHLHENAMPSIDDALERLWHTIMNDPNHHIIVGTVDDVIISSCVLLIVPNLTHGQKPYALIENVITHPAHRGNGYATQILDYAKALAADRDCYKIMLMTGSKEASTLRFYERAGYNRTDKTAFIQWLK